MDSNYKEHSSRIAIISIKHILNIVTIAKMDSTTNFNLPHLHINSPSIIETITFKYIVRFLDHVSKSCTI
jgi:hypothetical protein